MTLSTLSSAALLLALILVVGNWVYEAISRARATRTTTAQEETP